MNTSKTGLFGLEGLIFLALAGCTSYGMGSLKTQANAAGMPGSAGQPAAMAGASAMRDEPSDAGNPQTLDASTQLDDACSGSLPFKAEGCSCEIGQTVACWTGPSALRNIGNCHDGVQTCGGSSEFGTWQACKGEELNCSNPPTMPPPPTTCACIPGTTIQCDEDCAALLFCSLTAQKDCQPDGSWGACHEAAGNPATLLAPDGGLAGLVGAAASIIQPVDDAGVPVNGVGPCRSMFHGCSNLGILDEVFTGDCSQQFKCGHPPAHHSVD